MNRRGSQEIRAELDRTRASLDRAFDALGSRLTPSQLLWDGLDVFRSGATTGVSRAMKIAQDHPLPACVIGVGVGWLLFENARGGRADLIYEEGLGTEPAREGHANAAVHKAAEVASRAGERVTETAEAIRGQSVEAAAAVKDKASQAADAVRAQATRAAETVRHQASHAGEQARDVARRAGGEFDRMLREEPLTVGLGALAVGVLAGLLLPGTRREDEALGEVRDRKLEHARDAAREVLDKGKQVVRTAVQAAKETARQEAERQQVTPRAVVETVIGG
jgi:ElaB/YqjD/DUF883 family membrane-anchored ribosome-binding protein